MASAYPTPLVPAAPDVEALRHALSRATDPQERDRLRSQIYYATHKQKVLARQRQFYQANPEKGQAKSLRYRQTHTTELRARERRYRQTHTTELRAYRRSYRQTHTTELRAREQRYYQAKQRSQRANPHALAERRAADTARLLALPPEALAARRARWRQRAKQSYARRRAHYRMVDRQWKQAHPEHVRAQKNRHRARKRQAPINDLTAAQWREIKQAYGYRCVYCHVKTVALAQEHLTPLSKGGSHTAPNVVPACTSCNSKKGVQGVLCPVQPLLLTIAPPKDASGRG